MIELLDAAAEDVEELVVAWLTPLGRTSVTRKTGDTLPFRLVTHIAGSEDPDMELASPIVSVHTLCERNTDGVPDTGWESARDEAKLTHRRMLELGRYRDTIALSDGREAAIDFLTVTESPRWEPFGDEQILRKVGRYQIGLSYVSQPAQES